MLGVENLSIQYDHHMALHNVNVRFEAGQFTAIIGPNGAGKSSLLKSLAGLIQPTSGKVIFDAGHTPKECVSYVPQQQTLDWAFPVTVWDVAMMGRTARLGWLRWPKKRDHELVTEALHDTGVYDLRDRHISELSGGQRQRVLLARMLARQSHLLLLDEPMTGIDRTSKITLFKLLQQQAQKGRAVVMVTHDVEQARQGCDCIVMINRQLIASGPPEQVCTPPNIEATFNRAPQQDDLYSTSPQTNIQESA